MANPTPNPSQAFYGFMQYVHPELRPIAERTFSPYLEAINNGVPPKEAWKRLHPKDGSIEQFVNAAQSGQLPPGYVPRDLYNEFSDYMTNIGIPLPVVREDTGVREGVGPFLRGVIEPFKGLYNLPWDVATAALEDPKHGLLKALGTATVSPMMHGGSEFVEGVRNIQQGDVGQGLARALLGVTETLSFPAMFVSPLAAGAAMATSAAGLHGLQKYRDTGEFPVSSTLGEAAGGTLMAALGGGRGTPTNIAQEAAETASALPRAITRGIGIRLPFGEGFRAGVLRETVTSPAKATYDMLQKAQLSRGLWPSAATIDPYTGQVTAMGHLSQMVSGARRFVGEILGEKGRRLDKVEFWEMQDPYTGSRYIVNTGTGEVLDAFPPDVAKIRQSRELFKKPVHDAKELAAAAHGVKEILWKRYEKLFLDPFGHEPITKADFDALRQNLLTRTDILKAEDIAALQQTYDAKQLPFKTVREAQQRLQVLNAELENYYRATREKPAVASEMQINTQKLRAEADAIRELLSRKAQELIQKHPERALAMLSPEARAALPDIATLANYVSGLPKNYGDAKLLASNLAGRYRLGWEGVPPGEEHAMIERIRFNLDEGPVTDFKAYASAPGIIRRLTTISPRNVAARTAGKMLVSSPELAEEVPFQVPVPSPGGPVGRNLGRIAAREVLGTPARMGQHQISKKQKEKEK
jgi:hypothetical protein